MRETVWKDLIRAIHASPHQAVLAVTGGGSKAISDLLEVPGASQTVLEAVVPYSPESLLEWLEGSIDQACAEPTARAMAMKAWVKARQFASEVDPRSLIGLAATASLASDRPKRGSHRVHIGLQTAAYTRSVSLVLNKDARDRSQEEELVSKLILVLLGQACEVDCQAAMNDLQSQLHDKEEIEVNEIIVEGSWTELLLGERKSLFLPAANDTLPKAVFPGSFNPPHQGHRRICEIAEQRIGRSLTFELSIANVDKPPLDFIEIQQRYDRLCELIENPTLVVTNAPTFRAKSEIFPDCTFVVGADTLSRIADYRYYDGDEASFQAAIQQVADQGCRFLVFGREINGSFQVLEDLKVPERLREICDSISAEEYREDISSSELRKQKKA